MRNKVIWILAASALLIGCKAQGGADTAKPADTAAASAQPEDEAYLVALGTEPFWSVAVTPQGLTYSTPELPDGLPVTATPGRIGKDRVFTGTLEGHPFLLRLREEACSDGMSDTSYPFSAQLDIFGEVQQGCARTGKIGPG